MQKCSCKIWYKTLLLPSQGIWIVFGAFSEFVRQFTQVIKLHLGKGKSSFNDLSMQVHLFIHPPYVAIESWEGFVYDTHIPR